MVAALLALGASVAFGTSDFVAAMQSRRTTAWAVSVVSQPAALLVAALLLLLDPSWTGDWKDLLPPLLGGVAVGGGLVFYYLALSQGTMSVVAPVASACAIVPVAVGLAAGERASAVQYVGMALALAGIVLSSRAETRGSGRVGLRSVLFALAAAAGFGAVMVGLGLGSEHGVLMAIFVARLGSAVSVGAYVAVRRPSLDLTWRAVPASAAVGVIGMVAVVLFAVATTIGYLSVVAVLSTLSPVVLAIYARVFAGERLTGAQFVAAFIVVVGVMLLVV